MMNAKRSLPLAHVLTVGRFFGIVPLLILLVREQWVSALVLATILLIGDLVDGPVARSRNNASSFGAWLDSAVDKASFIIVFLAMAVWGWIPEAVFWFVVATQSLQLIAFFIYQKEGLRAPITGMMFWTSCSLIVALLTRGDVAEVAWLCVMLAATNHLAFYLFPLLRPLGKSGVWKKSVQSNFVGSYLEAKWKGRSSVDGPFRYWSWANAVTLLRFIVGVLLWDELWSQHLETAFVLGALFIVLDMADGALARSFKTNSVGGKMLDALVDKSIFAGVLIVLTLQFFLPISLALVTIGRYAAIGVIAALLIFFRKPLPVAFWSIPANAALALIVFVPSTFLTLLAVLLQVQVFFHYDVYAVRCFKRDPLHGELTRK